MAIGQRDAGPRVEDFEEEATTQFVVSSRPELDDELSESETLLPGAALADAGLGNTSDISLDEFMRTDSFEVPLPGFIDSDDDADATLMPDQVAPSGQRPLAIDDVFDVTAEGAIPPVAMRDEDDGDAPTGSHR